MYPICKWLDPKEWADLYIRPIRIQSIPICIYLHATDVLCGVCFCAPILYMIDLPKWKQYIHKQRDSPFVFQFLITHIVGVCARYTYAIHLRRLTYKTNLDSISCTLNNSKTSSVFTLCTLRSRKTKSVFCIPQCADPKNKVCFGTPQRAELKNRSCFRAPHTAECRKQTLFSYSAACRTSKQTLFSYSAACRIIIQSLFLYTANCSPATQ